MRLNLSLFTEVTGLTIYTVDTEVQDKFFIEINLELQKVDSFFRGKYFFSLKKN